MKMHKEVGYDRMTGVKNVRSFLSSYLEKDNSLGGHHLLVGEWPTLVTKFCACFAIRRASAEFHCSLHLKIKSIKIFHNFFLSLLFSLDVFSLFHRLFENNKKKLKNVCLSLGIQYVTVYRKIGHNAAPTKIFIFGTYRLLGKQILSSPSFIAIALAIPAIYRLTVPFVRLI